ncbi:MAG: hypothetical protein MSIBF_05355, partial [Candidatus Altiarchaeales archaeon IMC4]
MISNVQHEILEVLIELYEKKKDAVKGEDIAALLKRTPGTIRNQMQTLRALGYVDGVPGPKGGYTPTMDAYNILNTTQTEEPVRVPVKIGSNDVEGLMVQKIAFTNVQHPTECCAMISILGDTKRIKDGDDITVGPTPLNHIILKGRVIGRDDTDRQILVETTSITSIPKGSVMKFASTNIVAIPPGIEVRECAEILSKNKIDGAPVVSAGELRGIITLADIARKCPGADRGTKVSDIFVKDVI